MRKTVLIAGMSGLIGGIVRRRLEGACKLRALNRRDVEGVECHRADIADLEAIRPAFEGVDVVVHLSAAIRADIEGYIQSNVVGTYNVFEAAREAGVKRVIFASSGSTVAGWEQKEPYDVIAGGRYDEAPESWEKLSEEVATWPRGIYGCTKVWGEALARHFSDTYDMSFICLRIGAVPTEDRRRSGEPRHFSNYCSHENIGGMVEACVFAPDEVKFHIFYVVSNNPWSYRTMDHAREVLGFEPVGNAEDFR